MIWPRIVLVFFGVLYFPFWAEATHGSGKAIYSHSRNPIASFISSKNKLLSGNKRPAFVTNSNQVVLNSPSLSVQNETSSAIHSGNYYSQEYNPVQVIPITNAEEPKPYDTSSSNLVYLTVPSPEGQSQVPPGTTILNGNNPPTSFASSNYNALPIQMGTQYLQGGTYASQQQSQLAPPTLLQQPSGSSSTNNLYYGSGSNQYSIPQGSVNLQDDNMLLSQPNDNGALLGSSGPGESGLYYNGASSAAQQTGMYAQQIASTAMDSIYGAANPGGGTGSIPLQQPVAAPPPNNIYYANGGSNPSSGTSTPSQEPVEAQDTSVSQDSDVTYQTFGEPDPTGDGSTEVSPDPSTDFDYMSEYDGSVYYSEVPDTDQTEIESSTATPIPDNPLSFLNLVGTDFQPGRLVNIFFGLFIMLFMIISHGYALWILGIAYLPGTRSLNQWQLDRTKLDHISSLLLDAIDYWEQRID